MHRLLRSGLVIAASAFGAASAALAQEIQFDHVPAREFAIHLERLADDDRDRREVLEAFHDDYLASLRALQEHQRLIGAWLGRYRLEDIYLMMSAEWAMRLSGDTAGHNTAAVEFAAQFQEQYFESLPALFPDDAEEVDALQRMRRRQRLLEPATRMYTFATPDLIMLLHEIAPDAATREPLKMVLHNYDTQMDAVLRAFGPHANRDHAVYGQWRANDDFEKMADAIEDDYRLRGRMRDINRSAAASIAQHLSGDERKAFEEKVLEESYPSAFAGVVHSRMGLLLNQPGLTDVERAQLEALRAEIEQKRDALMPELRRRYDDWFERDSIRAYAEEYANQYLGRKPLAGNLLDPWRAWQEVWLAPLHEFGEGFEAEADAVATALNERDTVSATGAPPPPQHGQDMSWAPAVRPDDIDAAVQKLAFDADRAAMVRDLHRQYAHIVRTEGVGMALRHHATRRAPHDQPIEEQNEHRRTAFAESRDMQKRFVEFNRAQEGIFRGDVMAMLDTPQQREVWNRVMDACIRRGRIAFLAERMVGRQQGYDVSVMLEEAVADAQVRDDIERVVTLYHTRLDELITPWQTEYHDIYCRYLFATLEHGADSQESDRIWDQMRQRGRTLELLNDATIDSIGLLLSDAEREKLHDAVMTQKYPGIHHETPAERYFVMIEARPKLAPADRAALADILFRYEQQQQAMRARLRAAVNAWRDPSRAAEARQRRAKLQEQGKHPMTIYEEHPALPLLVEDNALVHRTMRAIRALYAPEAFEALPPEVRILMAW